MIRKKRKTKLSIFNKLIYGINLLVAILLLLGFLLPYISPNIAPKIAVLSLTVPILFIVNILFVLYWLIGLKRQFLLSFLCLLFGLYASSSFYNWRTVSSKSNNQITVMSYNVRLFNKYNWINDKTILKKLELFFKQEKPDIISFQEYHPLGDSVLDYPFKYINIASSKTKIGQAIYSKFKIVNKGALGFKSSVNNAIFIDIVKNLDTIRIYNLHLESLGLQINKENFGQKNSEKLLQRLSKEFLKQQGQVEQVLVHKSKSNYPVILTGDFNNTAYSWAYKHLKNNMKDTFLERGNGFGKTFDIKGFPMRIDYIFADEIFDINQHKNYKINYSDHFPIMATIGL